MGQTTMKLFRSNGEEVRLNDTNFLGEGGEGSVWEWKGNAVKVALDQKKMQAMQGKYQRLSAIKDPRLVTPLELLFNDRGVFSGYIMELASGEPLARYFSMAWQTTAGIGQKDIYDIVESMGQAVEALHMNDVVGGDINEFNWSVHHKAVKLFDCDSWGVDAWSVSAMLPSIADPLVQGNYKKESDFFVLALLVFQLFTGVHPYRGGHTNYAKNAWRERMGSGASLMDAEGRFPKGSRGLGWIPVGLKIWLEGILSHKNRSPMPDRRVWEQGGTVVPSVNAGVFIADDVLHALSLRMVEEREWDVKLHSWVGVGFLKLADDSVVDLVRDVRYAMCTNFVPLGIIRTSDGEAYWVGQQEQNVVFQSIVGPVSGVLRLGVLDRIEIIGGRMFALSSSGWKEVSIRKMGTKVMCFISAQGTLSGRRMQGVSGGVLMASLGGVMLLAPTVKSGGGLSARWMKTPEGEYVWGAMHNGRLWGIGKRNGMGASYWEFFQDGSENCMFKTESDVNHIVAWPGCVGMVVLENSGILLKEGGAMDTTWSHKWKSPANWDGGVWVLAGKKIIRVGTTI